MRTIFQVTGDIKQPTVGVLDSSYVIGVNPETADFSLTVTVVLKGGKQVTIPAWGLLQFPTVITELVSTTVPIGDLLIARL